MSSYQEIPQIRQDLRIGKIAALVTIQLKKSFVCPVTSDLSVMYDAII